MVPFVLLGLLWGLTACTGHRSNRLVIYVRNTTPAQNRIWLEIAQQFQDLRPDLEVKLLNIPYDSYWPKLFTMISSGNPPDLVLMESGFYPSFVAKHAFLELSDLIRATPDFSLDEYYPEALRWLRIDDKIYGLPLDIAVILPFFNKDIFDRFKVPYPQEGWTVEDYLATARQLTRDVDGDGRTDVWGTTNPPWEVMLWSAGGEIVDDPERPRSCNFMTPIHQQTLQWILNARDKYRVTPRETELTAQIDPFLMQKVAIVWTGHWSVPDYKQRAAFKWDVAPLPAGAKGAAGYNFGSSFCIPARSKHHEAAWQAARFFCGRKGLRFMVEKDLITPALRDLAESSEFLGRTPPEHHRRFIDAIPRGHIYPKSAQFLEFRQMINSELEAVWAQKASVNEACQQISQRGTAILGESAE